MKYGTIGGLDKEVSRMMFGCDWIFSDTPERKAAAFQALDEVVSVGCNAFDTAHGYCGGESERTLGKWMQERNNREEVVILSKGAHHNADRKRVTTFDIESDLHDSLARLQTDYIDIYVLHRDDLDVPVGPIVEILNEYRERGTIRAFGGSNWTHQRLEEANEYAYKHSLQPFTASSPYFGLAEQVENPWGDGCVGLAGPNEQQARDWYLENKDVKIFAYSSMARRFFSGRIQPDTTREQAEKILDGAAMRAYFHPVNLQRLERAYELAAEKDVSVAQIAVAYAISHPLEIFALQAPRTLEEMEQNNQAVDMTLTTKELAWLDLQK